LAANCPRRSPGSTRPSKHWPVISWRRRQPKLPPRTRPDPARASRRHAKQTRKRGAPRGADRGRRGLTQSGFQGKKDQGYLPHHNRRTLYPCGHRISCWDGTRCDPDSIFGNHRVVFEAVPGFMAIRRCPAARVAFHNRHSYEKALRFDRQVKKLGLYNDLKEIGSDRAAKNGFRTRC